MDVNIKHAGKTLAVVLDVEQPPSAFKDAVYQVTGVPVERMKIMVKGGVLKDDSDWKKIGPKPGQTFMVIGAAGELPKPPEKPVTFLEDMEDQELAEALAIPSGLKNLGNTCYMNATIQALRVIPPMQAALNTTSASGSLIPQLRDLYSSMLKTTDSITPLTFLQALRQALPQFAEQSRGGLGYAQQDAEEAYSQIVNCLRPVTDASDANKKFVEQWMMGEISRETKLEGDASLEPPTFSTEKVLKLECHISITTNYMATGIANSLQTTLTKRSPALGHEASYVQTTRVTRLPSFLTVHMVRFAWRADVGRKAKIMRKVKFPTTYDALEITSDELKARLMPVNRRLVEIDKGRAERRKIRLRKRGLVGGGDTAAMDVDDQGEPEDVIRAKEREEIEGLVDPVVKADIGASWSGLYDLVAIVTHKGAAADSGHYIGFAKKSAFHDPTYLDPKANVDTKTLDILEADEDWYKFDDDKVSVFPKEKLGTLDGGGEDSAAYVLVYRSRVV
ncbi:cysteine proteinase [Hymenopellis radicata]|nr:cysteine proteinase [Hymenopellis radicata]